MTKPKVSVITGIGPLKNYEYAIQGYFDDILQQSFFNECEFIICYVEWHPLIEHYARKYPNIRPMKDARCSGVYAAWNQMILAAKSDYITNWNIDDRRNKDALRIQCETLDKTGAMLVYNYHLMTKDPHDTWQTARNKNAILDPVISPHCGTSSIFNICSCGNDPMWRKEVVERVGYFNEYFKVVSDWDMWCKIAKYYGEQSLHFIPQPLGLFFQGSDTVSAANRKTLLNDEKQVVHTRFNQQANQNLLLLQPARLGDIIIVLPIAAQYFAAGYNVHMPVVAEYYASLREAVPYVNWAPVEVVDHTYSYLAAQELFKGKDYRHMNLCFCFLGNTAVSRLWQRQKHKFSFDQFKYRLANVDFAQKWNLQLTRYAQREQQLKDYYVNQEDYVVVHRQSSAGIHNEVQIPEDVARTHQVIELEPITHSVFDWLGLIEGAKAIYAIDSAVVNLVNQLNIGIEKYMFKRSEDSVTPKLSDDWHIVT